MTRWTIAQWGLFVIALAHVGIAVAGFVAEPSFAVGPGSPTAQVALMDYNGWHAVAGLALFLPGVLFAFRSSWAVAYLVIGGIAGALPGLWALFSHRVAYVFTFPNNITDAVVHLVTGAVMVGLALVQVRRDGGLRASVGDLLPTRGGVGGATGAG
jgi:hypothetical protein